MQGGLEFTELTILDMVQNECPGEGLEVRYGQDALKSGELNRLDQNRGCCLIFFVI